jgi:dTDP-4-dehydrorhamnose reductase
MEEMRFAITGATGFLGRRLCRALIAKFGDRCRILALGRKETQICEHVMSTSVDLFTELEHAKQVITEFKPNYLVMLAGKSVFNPPIEQHNEYRKVNTDIPYELAQLAYQINARVCYTSTDLVFDGKHGPYDVDSAPRPTTIYGESKWNAEKLLLGKALVVRLSVSYGLGGGFFQIMYDALKRGETLELFYDEKRSFCLGTEVVSMLIELLLKETLDLTKIWHVAGSVQASRYDFGLALAEVGGFDLNQIKSTSREIIKDVPRPENVCLISNATYQAVKFEPSSIKEGIRRALAEGVL